jgi:hypothetical protein
MRIARTFSLVMGLTLLAAVPAAAQSVSGTWVFSVNSPDGPVQMEVQLEQDGDEVKGDVQMDMADSAEISDGKLEDNVLTFLLHVGIQGETFSVEMTATVDGDDMTGQAFLADMGSMPFTATKAGGG